MKGVTLKMNPFLSAIVDFAKHRVILTDYIIHVLCSFCRVEASLMGERAGKLGEKQKRAGKSRKEQGGGKPHPYILGALMLKLETMG